MKCAEAFRGSNLRAAPNFLVAFSYSPSSINANPEIIIGLVTFRSLSEYILSLIFPSVLSSMDFKEARSFAQEASDKIKPEKKIRAKNFLIIESIPRNAAENAFVKRLQFTAEGSFEPGNTKPPNKAYGTR